MPKLVFFDCDSTLTTIEGIDYLAKNSEHYQSIIALTNAAMTDGKYDTEMYLKRLQYLDLSPEMLFCLADHYWHNQTLGAKEVISELKSNNYQCFLISAGLNPAVSIFGARLGIEPSNIYAVDYDFQGNITKNIELTTIDGKNKIITKIKNNLEHPESAHIFMVGDGANDLIECADLLIGFGGNAKRANLIDQFDYYIEEQDISSILPVIYNYKKTH